MSDQQKYTIKLRDQRILIIGGSSGIGYGVAEAGLEYGAHVTISSSSSLRLENAVSRLLKSYPSAKSRLSSYPCDVGNESTIEANLQTLLQTATSNGEQKFDHIVFTAGPALTNMNIPFAEASFEIFKNAGTVRFFAPMLLGKLSSSYLNPGPRSSLTLTTGTATERPIKGFVTGAITGALHTLNRSLALELAPLRCNLISPGPVETELWDSFEPELRERFMKQMTARLTTGRIGKVEDVVECYLCSMRDENLTGSLISTNGGYLITE
ncbi:MAG: hypothetical protein M1820_008972 [Bogoriella megaspora]|nr:MAG: hypothetical protein M1820_008972 [Bogoriella megaspora]